ISARFTPMLPTLRPGHPPRHRIDFRSLSMRHRRGGYRLGRTTAHRASTLRNIAAALFEHGQITTTIPKAKAVQPMVEKIITLAKRGDLHARRLVIAKLGGDRRAFDWLYLAKN